MSNQVTPDEVAAWMLGEIERAGELYQVDAVDAIEKRFGSRFIYENRNGNPAIDPAVLKAFRAISETTVVWHRRWRSWERRKPDDEAARGQQY